MFLFAAFFAATAAADEGMWLLPYLQKMNIADMRAKGCELSAEEIYVGYLSSLNDAIVIFGAGCTCVVVSPEGLLLTNHHCGYGAIQSLSSVEHDFLKNGFWARSRAEELPAPGLEVRFVRRIADVTAAVSQIDGKELQKMPMANISQGLAGRLPGLISVQNSGQTSSDQASMTIRGAKSGILYIVDGVQRSINDIDPNDVESVSLLKDGAAVAVYGLEAAGGVMIEDGLICNNAPDDDALAACRALGEKAAK